MQFNHTDKKARKAQLRRDLYALFKKRCFYCGKKTRLPVEGDSYGDDLATIDRIVPGSRGGLYTFKNCVLACQPCNSSRGSASPHLMFSGSVHHAR